MAASPECKSRIRPATRLLTAQPGVELPHPTRFSHYQTNFRVSIFLCVFVFTTIRTKAILGSVAMWRGRPRPRSKKAHLPYSTTILPHLRCSYLEVKRDDKICRRSYVRLVYGFRIAIAGVRTNLYTCSQ